MFLVFTIMDRNSCKYVCGLYQKGDNEEESFDMSVIFL